MEDKTRALQINIGCRLNSSPSLGESLELSAVPIENIASWPGLSGEDTGPNRNSNIFIPRKRSKRGLPDLLNGNSLNNEISNTAGKHVHIQRVGGREPSLVVGGHDLNLREVVLDATDPDGNIFGDTAILLKSMAKSR